MLLAPGRGDNYIYVNANENTEYVASYILSLKVLLLKQPTRSMLRTII